MNQNNEALFRSLPSVLSKYTEDYLVNELGLTSGQIKSSFHDRNDIELVESSLTAIMGLGGTLKVIVAFSFEKPLADYMVSVLTQGLSLDEYEMASMRYECAGEVLNICSGLVMAEMQRLGDTIALSPPIVISEARTLHSPRNSAVVEVLMTTEKGNLHIIFAAPAERFRRDLSGVN